VSRIEEAMRRAGSAGARPVPPASDGTPDAPRPDGGAADAAHAESAWTFDEAPGESASPPPVTLAATPAPAARAETRRELQPEPREAGAPEEFANPIALDEPVPTPPVVFVRDLPPALAEKLVVTSRMAPASVEQYRKLAATLHHAQADREIRVVMVFSALAGEGKSLTATNVALTLSESYRRRVLLVDADLRRPSLHDVFQVPNISGLSDGLQSTTERKLSLLQVSPTLTLLPAGRPDPDPMGSLSSERMRRVLHEASTTFDWVIVDTPPVGLLPDAHLLAAMVDSAILVVQAGRTPHKDIQRAIETVGRDRILGVVLNRVEPHRHGRGYGYDYAYSYGYGARGGNDRSSGDARDARI
jgi:capsular exopolysaccharide synthesis family protein